jgi:hypothetical protein
VKDAARIDYASPPAAAPAGALSILAFTCAIVALVIQAAMLLLHSYFFNAFWTSIAIMGLAPLIGTTAGAIATFTRARPRSLAILGLAGSVLAGLIFILELVYTASSPNFLKGMIG